LLYRAFLLITLLFVLIVQPDSFQEWVPIVLLFASSGLATANTSIHRYRGK
jgi:hypothetical protein